MLEEYDHSRCTHLIAKHCKSDLFDQVTHCTCHTMHAVREVCMVDGEVHDVMSTTCGCGTCAYVAVYGYVQ